MRDPLGRPQRYLRFFEAEQTWPAILAAGDSDRSLAAAVNNASSAAHYYMQNLARHYGFGTPLPELLALAPLRLDQIHAALGYVHARGPELDPVWAQVLALHGTHREAYGFAAIALTLLPSAEQVEAVAALVYRQTEYAHPLLDVLIKSFAPGFVLRKKYRKDDKYSGPWTGPVLRALAAAPEERAAALAAHMQHWCRLMRPFGWRSDLLTAQRPDDRFDDFAFEVALAVCAYDIDDSAFRAHLWYPRDLVDHYRAHVRHTRDAWRAHGAGAGVAVSAPAPPARIDLAKSRRKALARWVELAADGDSDATDAVLELVGKPRKVSDLGALAQALSDNALCMLADLKDDATLAQCCQALADARGLGEFVPPAAPAAGLARCEALLGAFCAWCGERGYQLLMIDNDDDAWLAILVRQAFCGELQALGHALGLQAHPPALS